MTGRFDAAMRCADAGLLAAGEALAWGEVPRFWPTIARADHDHERGQDLIREGSSWS